MRPFLNGSYFKSVQQSPWVVIILALCLFVPFIGSVHLFDWDEINFAESAREMLLTGEFFRVQINFEPFWEKPPLFFWMQALCMNLFSVGEFAARLPNALCGAATLALVFIVGKKQHGHRFAWLWVLFWMGSYTPAFYFKSGIIDPWFNFFILSTVLVLAHAKPQPLKSATAAGVLLGLAFLTKGPVALLITALSVLAFAIWQRSWWLLQWKPMALTTTTFLVLASVWVLPETIAHGPAVLEQFVAYQWQLLTTPVAGHGQPWFYHALVLLVGCLPASVFALQWLFTRNREPDQLGAWLAVLFWVVLILFSAVTTKIVHYSSLCFAPITYFAARAALTIGDKSERLQKVILGTAFALNSLLAIAFMVAGFLPFYATDLAQLVADQSVRDALSAPLQWSGTEWMPGAFMFGSTLALCAWQKSRIAPKKMGFWLGANAVAIATLLALVVPRVEAISQGGAISFYEEQGQLPVLNLGHKSYAPFFYGRTVKSLPSADEVLANDSAQALFVVKTNHLEKYLTQGLVVQEQRGGFALLRKQNQRDE